MSWWLDFYDLNFADRFLRQPFPGEIDFLARALGPGPRLLEQCCGVGRLTGPMSRRGYAVVGVDFTPAYLERARQSCPEAEFALADVGDYVADPLCDGGYNSYLSFGASADRQASRAVLACAARSLRPGGRFVLDTINSSRVLRDIQPQQDRSFPDGTRLQRESRVEWETGMLHQIWRWSDGRIQHAAVRLFLPWELAELLESVGLEPLELHGGFLGEAYGPTSHRLIWVARRRESLPPDPRSGA